MNHVGAPSPSKAKSEATHRWRAGIDSGRKSLFIVHNRRPPLTYSAPPPCRGGGGCCPAGVLAQPWFLYKMYQSVNVRLPTRTNSSRRLAAAPPSSRARQRASERASEQPQQRSSSSTSSVHKCCLLEKRSRKMAASSGRSSAASISLFSGGTNDAALPGLLVALMTLFVSYSPAHPAIANLTFFSRPLHS